MIGLYSYLFQSSRGACGRANHMRTGGFEPVSFPCFAARSETAVQAAFSRRAGCASRSPGASSAEPTRGEAEEAELKAVEVSPPGKCRASRKAQGARDAGSPVVLAVTTISVCFPLSAHGAPGASGAPASRAALALDCERKSRGTLGSRSYSATRIPPAQRSFGY